MEPRTNRGYTAARSLEWRPVVDDELSGLVAVCEGLVLALGQLDRLWRFGILRLRMVK